MHSTNKKILITGASGFIGSFLVEEALAQGFDVWAGVRGTSKRDFLSDPRIRFFNLDLSDKRRLLQQLEAHVGEHGAFDCVVHAAGLTKCLDPADFMRVNADGTQRLAEALVGAKALSGRFVFLSSLSVYGAIHEDDALPITLSDEPRPNTAYAASKLEAERRLKEIDGLRYVILRPTGVYGPRERDYFLMAQSIGRHVDFAVGYRPQVITFVYVRDVVQAAFLALEKGTEGTAYALTDGAEYSSRAFSDLLQREMGVRGVLHIKAPLWILRLVCAAGEQIARRTKKPTALNNDKYAILSQRNWRADISPAVAELGYCPAWTLARGVAETVAWYKDNGWL